MLMRAMGSVGIVFQFFGLAFSALLPVINPLGSALVFLGLVGDAPAPVIRTLARKIAISTVLFLLVVELVGTAFLAFFGISLPVVQVAGGLVLAAMGWNARGHRYSPGWRIDATDGGWTLSLRTKTLHPMAFRTST